MLLLRRFCQSLKPKWQRQGIGLAVSGGVDSMAMAQLASMSLGEYAHGDHDSMDGVFKIPFKPRFIGFIVDHKLRDESATEAKLVAKELQRLGIEPRILTLDWTGYPDRSTINNVESLARKLRYQALGTACRDRGIGTLLFAHHAEDVAETVLGRIYAGYLGAGLHGPRPEKPIPECFGLHGVSESGNLETSLKVSTDDMPIEEGGVTICRPLLNCLKSELWELCTSTKTKWFEDQTNADRTLTLRNTIRHLLKTNELPVALRRQRLAQLTESIGQRDHEMQRRAAICLQQAKSELYARTGTAYFSAESLRKAIATGIVKEVKQQEEWNSTDQAAFGNTLAAYVARMMIEPVAPTDTISLQAVDDNVDFLLSGIQSNTETPLRKAHSTLVNFELDPDSKQILVARTRPRERERRTKTLLFHFRDHVHGLRHRQWSDWQLWDGRYWIRISPPISSRDSVRDIDVVVRFLVKEDVAALRKHGKYRPRETFDAVFKRVPPGSKYSLPALTTMSSTELKDRSDAKKLLGQGDLVALPTLGWSTGDWSVKDRSVKNLPNENRPVITETRNRRDPHKWFCEIRYKHVQGIYKPES